MRSAVLPAMLTALLLTGTAHGAIFTPCRVSPYATEFSRDKTAVERVEETRCAVANAVYAEWEARITAIRTLRDEVTAAANAGQWDAVAAGVDKAAPLLADVLKEAERNPSVVGASDLKAALSTSLVYTLQNAGLERSMNLDTALSEIKRAAGDDAKRSGAATALSALLGTVASNSISFGNNLASTAGNAATAADRERLSREARSAAMDAFGRAAGTPSSPADAPDASGGLSAYLNGFHTRFAAVVGVAAWTMMALAITGLLVFMRKAKPAALFKVPAATFGVSLAVWLVYLVAPFAVPFLGPLALGAALSLLPIRAVLGLGNGRPWIAMEDPKARLGALVVGAVACFGIAFALPAFVSGALGGVAACVALVLVIEGKLQALGRKPAAMGVDGLKVADDALHGSAGWGTVEDAAAKGRIGPAGADGFALGRLAGVPAGTDDRFRYLGHVLTCAPTGAGKGIGAVIPNLLEYRGSALVLDIKGENYAVTARQRRQLGHRVFLVDPFGVTGEPSHACNWLDRLDVTNPDCVAESAALAECLVIPSGKGENSHFDETARGLLQGLMLHVATLADPGRRHLGEVRRLLTADEEDFLGLMADMVADPDAAFGVPARAANTLMSTGDRERGSILSTARRSTAFLDDPRIVAALSRSDFALSQLKTDLVAVYIVIPPAKLAHYNRFMRGFIGSALAALTATQIPPRHKVAFFLDEFAQLGRMAAIEDAISLVRGYGVAFWIFIQDLSQLKGVYPKWHTFTANTAKQFFGTADLDTAKYISDSLGKATVEYETEGASRKVLELVGSVSDTEHVTGRSLLTPDEVMRLGPTKPIVLITGEEPQKLTRLNYLEDAEYKGAFGKNPYH